MHSLSKKISDQMVESSILDEISKDHAAKLISIIEKSTMYVDQYIFLSSFNLKPSKSDEIESHI